MMLIKRRIAIALSTIHEDEDGFYSSGRFVDLYAGIHLNATTDPKFRTPIRYLSFIIEDIGNLETVALRLEWQKKLLSEGNLDEILWMQFVACDIDLFHVLLRSVFDYLAAFIAAISDKPGQVSNRGSFEQLQNWVAKSEGNVRKIGLDLAQVVTSCEWFGELANVRDSIVHRGGQTIVFPERGRILFQVGQGFRNKISVPGIMFNENVVDFELYAGLLVGYLIAYLEEVAETAWKRLGLQNSNSGARNSHAGLRVICDWLKRVELLEVSGA